MKKDNRFRLVIGLFISAMICGSIALPKDASGSESKTGVKPTPTPDTISQSKTTPCMMPSAVSPPTSTPTPTPTPALFGPDIRRKKNVMSERTRESVALAMQSSDWDCDGISDYDDNCVGVPNPDQADKNEDRKGNACEEALRGAQALQTTGCVLPGPTLITDKKTSPTPIPTAIIRRSSGPEEKLASTVLANMKRMDLDCDGVSNHEDNCIDVPNPDQKDTNKDGFGDACEPARKSRKIIRPDK